MPPRSRENNIRKLEQALKESEARRQAILDSALDCFICTDALGRITDFNSAAERTFRLHRSAAIGKDLAEIIFPRELREQHRRELFADLAFGGIDILGSRLETRAVRANGSEFPAEVTVTYFAIKGKATFYVAVRDVTARKKAEETLVRLAAIVESSQDAIIGIDLGGQITSWNRGAERMAGHVADEAIGRKMDFLLPEDRGSDYTRLLADLRIGSSLENFETVWLTKEGRRLDVSLTTSSIYNADGEMVGGSVIGRDITARKLSEEALRKANETSIYGSPIPIVAADAQGQVTMWNHAAQQAFGWSENEVKGKPNPIIPPEESEQASRLHVRMLAGETLTGVEVRRKKRDGEWIDVSLSGTPLLDEAGKVRGIIGFLADITERKRAERALREAEEKYRGIFENAVEGIYQATPDGKYLSANPSFARMLGFASPAEACSGTHPAEYMDPERKVEFRALMSRDASVRNFEYQLRGVDGKILWVSENAHTVRDADGATLYYEGTIEDITRHRELEEQLRQMQKIEAIGRLAGGVAHDFNNILMAISSYAELLCRKLSETDTTRRYVDEIMRATDRGSSLTQSLLAFSRKQVLSPRMIDLNALVSEQINMLERLLGENVTIRFQPGAKLGQTKVDPGQVQQVVMNLVINARDAMAKGGEVLIETANAQLDQAKRESEPKGSGEYIMLAVSDSGCGMDAETKSHIFEPFFTTKEQGKGTGLGLATVFGIVKQSSGQIFVQSERGVGTTFKVYFPRVEGAASVDIASRQSSSVVGHETILLVEDEASVREPAAEYLAENGYTVLTASNGAEALDIAARHKNPVHLLLTDVVMPQMSGKELSDKFAALYPQAKIVFMSGYSNNLLSNQQALDPGHILLQKPFRLSALGQCVRDALNGASLGTSAGM